MKSHELTKAAFGDVLLEKLFLNIRKTVFKNFRPSGLLIIKKRLQHRCFPVNVMKFFRTHILNNICEQLLLKLKA